jgi:antitoxin component of RelBE/YafQ-DinJ toxin-antitoxin module
LTTRQYRDQPSSIRLTEDLRRKANSAAEQMGMTFSQFARQALIRNIQIAMDIEQFLAEKRAETLK